MLTTQFASHFVAVLRERVDLLGRKPVQVGSDRLHLSLNDGMQRRRILLHVNGLGDGKERESRVLAEVLAFELPDTIPQNVRGTHGLANDSERCITQDLKGLAGIADENVIKGRLAVP